MLINVSRKVLEMLMTRTSRLAVEVLIELTGRDCLPNARSEREKQSPPRHPDRSLRDAEATYWFDYSRRRVSRGAPFFEAPELSEMPREKA